MVRGRGFGLTERVPSALRELQSQAESDVEGFWSKEAEKVNWFSKWSRALTWNPPTFRWFAGGKTNLSYNCLDAQVDNGRGSHTALIAENENGKLATYTYSELLVKVKQLAAALRGLGVKRGDRVAIYMPPAPEAIAAMLATTRIGAIHLVVFAGFGSEALAERIRLSGAKVLLCADATWRRGKEVKLWPIVERAVSEAGSPIKRIVLLPRTGVVPRMTQGRDLTWEEFLSAGRRDESRHEEMESNEPAYILATSGTTASPKLAVHTHGGYQVWLRSTGEWLFGFNRNDIWWSISDIGWIVGHSYMIYTPFMFGCTSIAYEGVIDYPSPETFYRIIEQNSVTGIFMAPTAVRLLMRYGKPHRTYDLGSVRRVFCAGEVLNPPAWEWLQGEIFRNRIPVIDHMWQTETGGPIIGNPYGLGLLPIKPGSATMPLPGVSVEVRSMDGKPCRTGERGIVVITRPFPGLTPTIWGDPERYKREYWERIPGVYFTGDSGYQDEDGYLWFSGRADEIIKIAAHRIGTIEVESAMLRHPSVAEAGVTGRPDELRGEVISAFVVLRSGSRPSAGLKDEIAETVRQHLGPVAVIGEINFVPSLPKTRSGKIMRRVLKAVVLDKDPGNISTIEDEGSVEEARQAWRAMKAELA
jgi:acetyl-CoA synthetase